MCIQHNIIIAYQFGRVVKAADSRSAGRQVRVGSNPTVGIFLFYILQPKQNKTVY